jgi:hypothetical protein
MELRRALLITVPILGVVGLYMTCLWAPVSSRPAATRAPAWSAPAPGGTETKVDDVSLLRREMAGRVESENAESQAGPDVHWTSALGFF